MNFTLIKVFIRCIYEIKINYNKNCAQEIRQVKVPQLALSQLALPPTGTFPDWPLPRAKIPQLPSTILVYSFMLLILSILIQNKIEIPRWRIPSTKLQNSGGITEISNDKESLR